MIAYDLDKAEKGTENNDKNEFLIPKEEVIDHTSTKICYFTLSDNTITNINYTIGILGLLGTLGSVFFLLCRYL